MLLPFTRLQFTSNNNLVTIAKKSTWSLACDQLTSNQLVNCQRITFKKHESSMGRGPAIGSCDTGQRDTLFWQLWIDHYRMCNVRLQAPTLSYWKCKISHWFPCGPCGVDGRLDDQVITKISRMDTWPNFLCCGAPLIIKMIIIITWGAQSHFIFIFLIYRFLLFQVCKLLSPFLNNKNDHENNFS